MQDNIDFARPSWIYYPISSYYSNQFQGEVTPEIMLCLDNEKIKSQGKFCDLANKPDIFHGEPKHLGVKYKTISFDSFDEIKFECHLPTLQELALQKVLSNPEKFDKFKQLHVEWEDLVKQHEEKTID